MDPKPILSKLGKNKLLIASLLSVLIIGVLFYSTPALAFWMNPSTNVSATRASESAVDVTITFSKVSDEMYASRSNITAMPIYQDLSFGEAVNPTNCSLDSSEGYGYGYQFNSYGYGGDYSQTGYGYYSGYGSGSSSDFSCTFRFEAEDEGVMVGVGNVTINGIPLGTSSTSSGNFTRLFGNSTVYSHKNFTYNDTDNQTYRFKRYNETDPVMEVNLENGTKINDSTTYTNTPLSIDVIVPSGSLESGRVMGAIFKFGPAGTTFAPPLQLTVNYSLFTTAEQTAIETLNTAGNLRIMMCNDALTSCNASAAYSIDTTNNLLTFYVSHFSAYATYDSTPVPVTPTYNSGSSSNGGGSYTSGKYLAPVANDTTTTTEQPATTTDQSKPTPQPTPTEQPAAPTEQPKPTVVPSTETIQPTVPAVTEPKAQDSGLGGILPMLGIVVVIGAIGAGAYLMLKPGKK